MSLRVLRKGIYTFFVDGMIKGCCIRYLAYNLETKDIFSVSLRAVSIVSRCVRHSKGQFGTEDCKYITSGQTMR